jgi:hypothetical protein
MLTARSGAMGSRLRANDGGLYRKVTSGWRLSLLPVRTLELSNPSSNHKDKL